MFSKFQTQSDFEKSTNKKRTNKQLVYQNSSVQFNTTSFLLDLKKSQSERKLFLNSLPVLIEKESREYNNQFYQRNFNKMIDGVVTRRNRNDDTIFSDFKNLVNLIDIKDSSASLPNNTKEEFGINIDFNFQIPSQSSFVENISNSSDIESSGYWKTTFDLIYENTQIFHQDVSILSGIEEEKEKERQKNSLLFKIKKNASFIGGLGFSSIGLVGSGYLVFFVNQELFKTTLENTFGSSFAQTIAGGTLTLPIRIMITNFRILSGTYKGKRLTNVLRQELLRNSIEVITLTATTLLVGPGGTLLTKIAINCIVSLLSLSMTKILDVIIKADEKNFENENKTIEEIIQQEMIARDLKMKQEIQDIQKQLRLVNNDLSRFNQQKSIDNQTLQEMKNWKNFLPRLLQRWNNIDITTKIKYLKYVTFGTIIYGLTQIIGFSFYDFLSNTVMLIIQGINFFELKSKLVSLFNSKIFKPFIIPWFSNILNHSLILPLFRKLLTKILPEKLKSKKITDIKSVEYAKRIVEKIIGTKVIWDVTYEQVIYFMLGIVSSSSLSTSFTLWSTDKNVAKLLNNLDPRNIPNFMYRTSLYFEWCYQNNSLQDILTSPTSLLPQLFGLSEGVREGDTIVNSAFEKIAKVISVDKTKGTMIIERNIIQKAKYDATTVTLISQDLENNLEKIETRLNSIPNLFSEPIGISGKDRVELNGKPVWLPIDWYEQSFGDYVDQVLVEKFQFSKETISEIKSREWTDIIINDWEKQIEPRINNLNSDTMNQIAQFENLKQDAEIKINNLEKGIEIVSKTFSSEKNVIDLLSLDPKSETTKKLLINFQSNFQIEQKIYSNQEIEQKLTETHDNQALDYLFKNKIWNDPKSQNNPILSFIIDINQKKIPQLNFEEQNLKDAISNIDYSILQRQEEQEKLVKSFFSEYNKKIESSIKKNIDIPSMGAIEAANRSFDSSVQNLNSGFQSVEKNIQSSVQSTSNLSDISKEEQKIDINSLTETNLQTKEKQINIEQKQQELSEKILQSSQFSQEQKQLLLKVSNQQTIISSFTKNFSTNIFDNLIVNKFVDFLNTFGGSQDSNFENFLSQKDFDQMQNIVNSFDKKINEQLQNVQDLLKKDINLSKCTSNVYTFQKTLTGYQTDPPGFEDCFVDAFAGKLIDWFLFSGQTLLTGVIGSVATMLSFITPGANIASFFGAASIFTKASLATNVLSAGVYASIISYCSETISNIEKKATLEGKVSDEENFDYQFCKLVKGLLCGSQAVNIVLGIAGNALCDNVLYKLSIPEVMMGLAILSKKAPSLANVFTQIAFGDVQNLSEEEKAKIQEQSSSIFSQIWEIFGGLKDEAIFIDFIFGTENSSDIRKPGKVISDYLDSRGKDWVIKRMSSNLVLGTGGNVINTIFSFF